MFGSGHWSARQIVINIILILLTLAAWAWLSKAMAHDWRRADLDGWYGALKRPGVQPNQPYGQPSCCSKTDCHTTEAELRGADWWARIGVQKPNGDWDLRDWVKVPAEAVLKNHDNPTGEGVICHAVTWVNNPNGTQTINPQWIAIWCFVPPVES